MIAIALVTALLSITPAARSKKPPPVQVSRDERTVIATMPIELHRVNKAVTGVKLTLIASLDTIPRRTVIIEMSGEMLSLVAPNTLALKVPVADFMADDDQSRWYRMACEPRFSATGDLVYVCAYGYDQALPLLRQASTHFTVSTPLGVFTIPLKKGVAVLDQFEANAELHVMSPSRRGAR